MTRSLPEVTEHFGVDEIQTGNSDIGTPEWKAWSGPGERAPLPGHEHRIDAMFGPGFAESIFRTTGRPVSPDATPLPEFAGRNGKEL